MVQMQSVQNKALTTVREGLLRKAARNGSFLRKIGSLNDHFAPSEKSAGIESNVPVNNC
jgi:hypothetical protein